MKDTFVYNLIKDGKVVYVGITNNPMGREKRHRLDKDFDCLKIVTEPLERNHAEFVEAALIQSYGFENLVNKNRAKLSYLLKHNNKLAECPICETLGCGISNSELKNIVETLTMEVCAECGKQHKRNVKNLKGKYICNTCYQKNYAPEREIVKCSECGKQHKRMSKNQKGEYICPYCYQKKYAPEKETVKCNECGKQHKKQYKNPSGEYICQYCYNKNYKLNVPRIKCSSCGKIHKRHHKNTNGGCICQSCYKDLKAQQAGYKDRFDASKQLGLPQNKIRWGSL